MSVKTEFSIKDLENLSGVKAHTIRIWEKRYNLLEPKRTGTNIRRYDLLNLRKLLNVTFLYSEGLKISKIADLNEKQINQLVLDQAQTNKEEYILNSLKTAMLGFDTDLFSKTYAKLIEERDFRNVFFNIFLPLLEDIGKLWQTGTIDPSHERFISELIKQKIVHHTDAVQQKKPKYKDFVFTLYLPYEEIHEIGLLYVNYEILRMGFRTIFLGNNIPLDSLQFIVKHHKKVKFISYFTVKPDGHSLREYIDEFNKKIGGKKNYDLWLMGHKTQELQGIKVPSNCKVIRSLKDLIIQLQTLKKS